MRDSVRARRYRSAPITSLDRKKAQAYETVPWLNAGQSTIATETTGKVCVKVVRYIKVRVAIISKTREKRTR